MQNVQQGRQLVWKGNFEQQVTAQSSAYARSLAYWKAFTNTQIPGIPALTSPIPGDNSTFQTFRATANVKDQNGNPIASDVSIGDFNARWAWIMQNQMPAYMTWSAAHPEIDPDTLLRGGYKR